MRESGAGCCCDRRMLTGAGSPERLGCTCMGDEGEEEEHVRRISGTCTVYLLPVRVCVCVCVCVRGHSVRQNVSAFTVKTEKTKKPVHLLYTVKPLWRPLLRGDTPSDMHTLSQTNMQHYVCHTLSQTNMHTMLCKGSLFKGCVCHTLSQTNMHTNYVFKFVSSLVALRCRATTY